MKRTSVKRISRTMAAIAVAALACSSLVRGADSLAPGALNPSPAVPASLSSDPRIVAGLSRPSEDRRISFEGSNDGYAVIASVKVKEGDQVKAGDEVMSEDSSQAVAEQAILEAGANSTGAVEEADVKIKGNAQITEELKNASAAGREITEAEMQRDTAIAQKKQAEDELKQKKLAYEKQKVKVDHMTLRSPIDGIVRRISIKAGEVVDANSNKDGVCEVVKNDPLWVEINLPPAQAGKLKKGEAVQVSFPDEMGKWRDAQVDYRDPVVEAGSNMQMVRVTLPNPENRDAGLDMIVRLPADVVQANTAMGSVSP